MEVEDTAERGAERRQLGRRIAAVEDEGDVRAAFVFLHPLDHRMPADLFLGIDREADVHGQLAGRGEELRCLERHEQMRLVVCDPASEEQPVALGQLPRIARPELERVCRLHIEMRVDEDGRRRGTTRGRDLTDHERPAVALLDLDRPARPSDPLSDPVGRAHEIRGVLGIGADGGDGDQFRKLGEELGVRRGGRHARQPTDGPLSHIASGDHLRRRRGRRSPLPAHGAS